jgi:NADH dehydrogenase
MGLQVPNTSQKRLIIVGGGFAGIELATKLKNADLQIVMIDKHNYHTFQPLLYQVATGGLEPGSISYPLRRALRSVPNAIFRMAEVRGIIPEENELETSIGNIGYDYLVIATGSVTNFFSLPESNSSKMMVLKSMVNALDLRSFMLQNFEEALLTTEDIRKQELINIAIVGAGPTGVELAGALGEMKRSILPKDYPELDFRKMQVHLFEASSKVLPMMSEEASKKAYSYIKNFDVHVWLNTAVTGFDGKTLFLNNNKTISADTVVWTAGVKGSVMPGISGEAVSFSSRYLVDEFNKVKGYENIYAIGDCAMMATSEFPKGHPMVAPVAIQQAQNLGKNLNLKLIGKTNLSPFAYHDKGSMATIGRNKAVADIKKLRFKGFFAWCMWMFVHVFSLIGFRNKLSVIVGWLYNYFTYDKALRLIIRPYKKY